MVTSNFFFFWVEIVSESTLIETSFARQSISSLPSRPRVTAPGARELDFSVPTVFKAIEDGVDRPKACLVPLKKKTWAWGMSPTPKVSYHTGQPANLRRANARIEWNVSWWTLEATATAFGVPTFATVLRNPWQGLTLTCSGPVSVAARHLSIRKDV